MERDNFPNTVEIYSQIVMYQNVSESRNRPPVDLGMKGLQMIADALRGFGESLEIAQNGVLDKFRLAEGRLAIFAVTTYASDAIEDMMDVEAVVLHKGIAS